jgi:GxxExxY protein
LTQMNSIIAANNAYPEKALSSAIIGAFYCVYNKLGAGFLESVYRRALTIELRKRGMLVEPEHGIDVWYDDEVVGRFRVDLLINRKVLVEIKGSQLLTDADWKQLLNYLAATKLEVGLLLHFGPRAFFRRLVHTCKSPALMNTRDAPFK